MFRLLRERLNLADLVLIGVVIAAIIGSAGVYLQKKDDRNVYMYKDGVLWGSYPLNQDRVLRIDAHNSVGIEHGKVRMLSADCPDKRCVKQGAGDLLPIICLPNQVVVEIRSPGGKRALIVR